MKPSFERCDLPCADCVREDAIGSMTDIIGDLVGDDAFVTVTRHGKPHIELRDDLQDAADAVADAAYVSVYNAMMLCDKHAPKKDND